MATPSPMQPAPHFAPSSDARAMLDEAATRDDRAGGAGNPEVDEGPTGTDAAPGREEEPPASEGATLADVVEEASLTRPERQWRHIAGASDASCREALAATSADFIALPDEATPNTRGCGMPRGVVLKRGVTGVRYSPPLRVDCSFALRLGEIERILAEEAEEHFQAKVLRIGHVGAYVCREVVGRLRGWSGGISEHSFGNAVDVTHFDLENGKRISVLHHYDSEAPAILPYRTLLRDLHHRVRREAGMRALGPDFDASHKTHFHFDAGSRWWRW